VSGSGKSSLVLETIAAESRRLINETYTAFIQGFMRTTARPDVESLEGLTAAIVVDQEPMGAVSGLPRAARPAIGLAAPA
jgi:excinuclease UvrABC ATPase subunit